MLREKLKTTLAWSLVSIGGAMLADYLISIVLLNDGAGYTPGVTFAIATIVTLPTTYALVSGRFDLRKARDEVAVARDAAVAADRTKTQFFSNMSHELRTPLNAIIGFSDLLVLDVFAGKRVEYSRLIHSSGKHLLSLVDDLLDLARIEAGGFELRTELVDAKALVQECVDTMATRARERRVRVVWSAAPDLPLLDADARALRQILLNLLTNAIKFTNPGGEVKAVAALDDAGGFTLAVCDTGIGIAPQDQAKVFERFGQARHDLAGIEKGTGLGLPIVKGLAEAHGGRVRLDSVPGSGTTVTVILPATCVVSRPSAALAS